MEKLDLQTPDFTSQNIARLAELFPNCATEKKNADGTVRCAIDFDLLSQELSHDLVEGPQERYRLDWPGKREALVGERPAGDVLGRARRDLARLPLELHAQQHERVRLLVDDGVVKQFNLEEAGAYGASSGESLLKQI